MKTLAHSFSQTSQHPSFFTATIENRRDLGWIAVLEPLDKH